MNLITSFSYVVAVVYWWLWH